MVRVPSHHAPRGRRGRRQQHGALDRPLARPEGSISRLVAFHLAWSGLILLAAGAVVASEIGAPCPPGGPLAFGSCADLRPFAVGVLLLATALYVTGLSGVLAWTRSLRRRGLADERAARDWYLLAACLGLLAAPLLAFTLASGLR